MKKIYVLIVFMCFFTIKKTCAQYSEVWSNSSYSSLVIGCENLDDDSQKEIVTLYGNNLITVIDGKTGITEWETGIWDMIGGGYNQSTGIYDLNKIPKLIDIDGNGKYEILFYGYKTYGDDTKWYLYSFGGNTKSDNNSQPKSTYIDNYPNPFNNETTIKYSVNEGNNVKVTVFNAEGKEINKLLNEYKSEGDYEVKFDGSDLKAGTYYYQVIIGNDAGAKKMILIK